MKEVLRKKQNQKGFTLAELLIVVAIIAILAAIAFPMFSSQLDKAKAGADLANLRSAISIASTELLTNNSSTEAELITKANTALGTPTSVYGDATKTFTFTIVDPGEGKTKTITADSCTFGGKTFTVLENAAK